MLFFHQKSQQAIFQQADFRDTMKTAQKGDVIYCDPPYVPLSDTAYFSSYTQNGFSEKDQIDLAVLAEELYHRGIPVIISNHNTPKTREYYHQAQLIEFNTRRLISCKSRNTASELLAVYMPTKS